MLVAVGTSEVQDVCEIGASQNVLGQVSQTRPPSADCRSGRPGW